MEEEEEGKGSGRGIALSRGRYPHLSGVGAEFWVGGLVLISEESPLFLSRRNLRRKRS